MRTSSFGGTSHAAEVGQVELRPFFHLLAPRATRKEGRQTTRVSDYAPPRELRIRRIGKPAAWQPAKECRRGYGYVAGHLSWQPWANVFGRKKTAPPPSDSSISFGYVREFGMRYCPRDEEWHLFLCRLFKKFAWDRSKGISDYDMYCRAKWLYIYNLYCKSVVF